MADRAELNWVNVMRAMCMMGVYVWHSETFTSAPDVLTPLISPFCMAAFFFVSGYLFYRKAFCEHDAKFYATCFSNILSAWCYLRSSFLSCCIFRVRCFTAKASLSRTS